MGHYIVIASHLKQKRIVVARKGKFVGHAARQKPQQAPLAQRFRRVDKSEKAQRNLFDHFLTISPTIYLVTFLD
jgi:DNA polymerase II large subunit